MKTKTAFAICVIGLMMGTSFAADLPVEDVTRPTPVMIRRATWTGLYFGVNAGYSWAQVTSNIEFTGAPFPIPGFLAGRTATNSASLSGGVAGGQIGFNWQTRWLVFGLEADGQWSGQQGAVTFGCGDACTLAETVKIRSFWSGRVRVGYAFDRLLAYATLGGAVVNASHDLTATLDGTTATFLPLSHSKLGLAAGIGVEAIVWENLSVRLEYLYLDVDHHEATGFTPSAFFNTPVTETSRFRDHILRAGANYRFGPND
jgi:outer membrane immunogenic protein